MSFISGCSRISRIVLKSLVSSAMDHNHAMKFFIFELVHIACIAGNSVELVPVGNMTAVDGWHTIQFSGGKNALTRFEITLFWLKSPAHLSHTDEQQQEESPLLKLRTDLNRVTPKTGRVLEKLPSWCSLFGKSTSPYALAFLSSLPINF